MITTETIQNKYSSLPPDKQQGFIRQVIFKVVNDNYGDRVSNFNVDETPKDGSVASGNVVTPKLGGQNLIVDWSINDNSVALSPRNMQALNHAEDITQRLFAYAYSQSSEQGYIPLEFYDFSQINCVKGWACGNACLSRDKKHCDINLNPEHKTYVEWLKSQLKAGVKLHKVHQDEAQKLGINEKGEGGEDAIANAKKEAEELEKQKSEKQPTKRAKQKPNLNPSKQKGKTSLNKEKVTKKLKAKRIKQIKKKLAAKAKARNLAKKKLLSQKHNPVIGIGKHHSQTNHQQHSKELEKALSEISRLFKGVTQQQKEKIAKILLPVNTPG